MTFILHLNCKCDYLKFTYFTSEGFLAKIKPPSICCIEVVRKDKLQALKVVPKESSDSTEPPPSGALRSTQFTLGPLEAQQGNMML